MVKELLADQMVLDRKELESLFDGDNKLTLPARFRFFDRIPEFQKIDVTPDLLEMIKRWDQDMFEKRRIWWEWEFSGNTRYAMDELATRLMQLKSNNKEVKTKEEGTQSVKQGGGNQYQYQYVTTI